jgi:hypothetical protein
LLSTLNKKSFTQLLKKKVKFYLSRIISHISFLSL